MALQQVRIIGDSLERMRALERYDLDLKHRAGRRLESGEFMVPGLVSDEQIDALVADGYRVERVQNVDGIPDERRAEVPRVDRFADARSVEDLAARTVLGYLTTAEIDSGLTSLAASAPALVSLITLPHTTAQGRACRAARLRAGPKSNRIGVLFTGGVHAREWGGSDILMYFLTTSVNAYVGNTPAVYGGKTFTAAQVKTLLESLDIFVFPNVNPDGKVYSQTTDPGAAPSNQSFWWRKNRNPNTGAAIGVDVNRNFDFLWSSGIGTSPSQSSATYKGTAPFSEPECRNIRHLLDTFPHIRYYVDIHSFGELLLYSWGDDENQSATLAQRFTNPAFNGLRGVVGDTAYREFIAPLDGHTAVNLANRMHAAIQAVRGRSYTVQQAVGLYPTSGTSDDYAFSRHIANPAHNKVYVYTIEFGNEFVPPYAEMRNIMNDIGAGITEFAWAALSDLRMRDNAADTGDIPSAGAFWNSPDVWVRNTQDGGTTHQNTLRGQDNFVYVRVNNRGAAEARDVRVRVNLSSFAGTEFVYPQNWIPNNPAGGGSITSPGTYWIGDAVVPSLAAGATTTVNVQWPAALVPPDAGWHPCLLVDTSPNDGLAPGGNEVRQHNNLAQKNITIVNARRGEVVDLRFIAGSAFSQRPKSALVVRTLKAPVATDVLLAAPSLADAIGATAPARTTAEPLARPSVLTLLHPVTVAFGGERAVQLRMPAQTRMQVGGGSAAAVLDAPPPPAAPGAGPPLGAIGSLTLDKQRPDTRLPFAVAGNLAPEARLTVPVPRTAKAGDVFEFEVVQEYDDGRVAGGVMFQINVM